MTRLKEQCLCTKCQLMDKENPSCPNEETFSQYVKHAKESYCAPGTTRDAMVAHSELLGRGGSKWPRIKHLVEFCRAGGITKVGFATCLAFLKEAHWLETYFAEEGIESITACCRMGGLKLDDLDIDKKLPYAYTSCNPVAQADFCNEHKTGVNVILGLCPGHDMIFNQHSEAMVTTLFVKEHISKHNPYATITQMMGSRS